MSVDLQRKISNAIFMAVILTVVVCTPVPEFESHQLSNQVHDGSLLYEQVLHRSPRQVNPNREQVINNIFQIPITTLNAVSALLQSTRPIQRPIRPYQTQASPVQAAPPAPVQGFAGHHGFSARGSPTRGARVAQVSPAADGSSFKI
ncbi:uncharacterized protein [Periplaneta americana]|uniref:uncharacterized protein n=1 Tax=Periplaneta americana TaxID=6978 RepID=UPI0037E8CE08